MGWIPVRRRYLPAAIRTRQPSADPEVVAAVDAVVAASMTAAEEVVDLSRVDDVLVPVVHSWTLLAGGDTDFESGARGGTAARRRVGRSRRRRDDGRRAVLVLAAR